MAGLHNKIENTVNEARILILGGQVVVGVQFRIFFEGDFQQVALAHQRLLFAGLAVLLLGLAFVMAPASYHTIVEKHRDTADFHRFTTAMLAIGLVPFAISFGATIFVTFEKLSTVTIAEIAAVTSTLVCIALWYALPFSVRVRRTGQLNLANLLYPLGKESQESMRDNTEKLTDQVKEVLTETRMVLPGAQALLGFQFINVWLSGFDTVSHNAKLVHLASLCSVGVATILLVLPAAYHRLAEAGEDSKQFVRFAGRMLLTAMVFLAVGICGDFFVIAEKLEFSLAVSLVLSGGMLVLFLVLWFGYTWWKRGQLERA